MDEIKQSEPDLLVSLEDSTKEKAKPIHYTVLTTTCIHTNLDNKSI